jgi:hypothetical protein
MPEEEEGEAELSRCVGKMPGRNAIVSGFQGELARWLEAGVSRSAEATEHQELSCTRTLYGRCGIVGGFSETGRLCW